MRWCCLLICLVLVIPVLSAGCGDDDSEPVDAFTDAATCMPPAEVEVSCEPLPEGTTEEGCSGRALNGASVPGGDEETVWPVGCEVRYPYCLDAYPMSVASCTCLEGTAPTWNCPV
jgi:hypothetical protein